MNFCTENTEFSITRVLRQVWDIKKYSYKNTARQDWGLLYLTHGKIIYTWENGRLEVFEGETVFLPKGAKYEAEFLCEDGNAADFLINFNMSGDFSKKAHPEKICTDYGKVLFSAFEEIAETFFAQNSPFLLKSLFYRLIYLLSEHNEKNIIPKQYLKAAEILSENSNVSVEQITKELFINRNTFQKQFKIFFGVSPAKYRCEKRLEHAKQMLETTDMSAKEIAFSLGFYDVAYFYKAFNQKYGTTPKKYRSSTVNNLI